MVTVFVWNFRGKREAWGHASLQAGNAYISWWPEQPGQVPSKWHRQIYASAPFRGRSLAEDVRDEKQNPDHAIRIDGLDETAIQKWWQSFGLIRDGVALPGPLLPWHTTSQNCSTVAARALRIGGGDTYAKWVHTWNAVWTPADVLAYARSIQRGARAMNAQSTRGR